MLFKIKIKFLIGKSFRQKFILFQAKLILTLIINYKSIENFLVNTHAYENFKISRHLYPIFKFYITFFREMFEVSKNYFFKFFICFHFQNLKVLLWNFKFPQFHFLGFISQSQFHFTESSVSFHFHFIGNSKIFNFLRVHPLVFSPLPQTFLTIAPVLVKYGENFSQFLCIQISHKFLRKNIKYYHRPETFWSKFWLNVDWVQWKFEVH